MKLVPYTLADVVADQIAADPWLSRHDYSLRSMWDGIIRVWVYIDGDDFSDILHGRKPRSYVWGEVVYVVVGDHPWEA